MQTLIDEHGEMTPFDLVNPADWTPLAYTSACEALKDFGEEVSKALKSKPSPTDLETTFKVRCSYQPMCSVGSMYALSSSGWCELAKRLPKALH